MNGAGGMCVYVVSVCVGNCDDERVTMRAK